MGCLRQPILCCALLLASWLPIQPVRAAGFDCQKARTPTERAVCADAALSVADEVMSAAYALVRAGGGATVADEQRDWLRRRNACVANVDCLHLSYALRLKDLRLEELPSASNGLALVRCDGSTERVEITPAPAGSSPEPVEAKLLRVPGRATLSWVLSTEHRHLDCQFDSGRSVRVTTGYAERYPYGRCGAAEDIEYSVWVDRVKWISRGTLFTDCDSWPWLQVKTELKQRSMRGCRLNVDDGQAVCDESAAPADIAKRDFDEFPDSGGGSPLPLYSYVTEHAADPALCRAMVRGPTPPPARPRWTIEPPPGAEVAQLPWVEPSGPRSPVTLVSRFDLDNDGREETVVSIHHEGRDRESSTFLAQRDAAAEAVTPPFSPSFLMQHTARVFPHAWVGCQGGWVTDPGGGRWDDQACSVVPSRRANGKPFAFSIRYLRLRPFRLEGRTYFLGLGPHYISQYPTMVWLPRPDGSAQEICMFRQVLKNL